MRRIQHLKWFYPAINYIPAVGNFKPQMFTVEFDEKSKYKSKEPEDMLKACGVSFSPILASRKNSVMLGYRNYNNEFQACIYWHNNTDGNKQRSDVLVGNKFSLTIYEYKVILYCHDTEESIELRFDDMGILKTGFYRTITPWAGGSTKVRNHHSFLYERNFRIGSTEFNVYRDQYEFNIFDFGKIESQIKPV
jgi:hypothetical protein